MGSIPERLYDLVDFPAVENLILPLLREAIPDVPIYSTIPEGVDEIPYVLARKHFTQQWWAGDNRGFINDVWLKVETFTQDPGFVDATTPGGDDQGSVLSEIVRKALRDSVGKVVPGVGHIAQFQVINDARRAADWTTATGPVQYADLPLGTWRYEAIYRLRTRHQPSS